MMETVGNVSADKTAERVEPKTCIQDRGVVRCIDHPNQTGHEDEQDRECELCTSSNCGIEQCRHMCWWMDFSGCATRFIQLALQLMVCVERHATLFISSVLDVLGIAADDIALCVVGGGGVAHEMTCDGHVGT